ncbi:MAG TPA: DUF4375 domain-containing protein [Haloferula sp.]
MHRRLLVTLGHFLIASATAQDVPTPTPAPTQPPSKEEFPPIPANWPGLEYAEVRAYLYNPGENPGNLILQKDKLHPEVTNPDGIKLDAAQVERLIATFRGKAANGMGVGCFEPHHGFVFYDREGKPVANVTVCFLCIQGVARPGPTGSMTTWDWDPLKRLVEDLGLPVFKTLDEAEAHFRELAHQWSDAKIRAAIDHYLFEEGKDFTLDNYSDLQLLQGLGERTHPFLLACLADKERRADLLKREPAGVFQMPRFCRLCDVFGDTPPAAAIPLLLPFLAEEDAAIRRNAIATITRTGAPEIVPIIREVFADTTDNVVDWAVSGLQVALDRGALQADTKNQLFPDVKALVGTLGEAVWAQALYGLDPDKGLEAILAPEIFKAESLEIDELLWALCEKNVSLPRERILKLIEESGTAELEQDQEKILGPALLLLGRQRNPADLERLRSAGDENLAECAMPGLLAWHGLEGYRERLATLYEEKGFAALSEPQRLHIAAGEFESSAELYYYFSDGRSDHWRDALAGLKVMKRDNLAAILEETAAKFGGDGPSTDRETRRKQADALEEKHAFDELDRRLDEARGLLFPTFIQLDRFAIEHTDSFK